MSREYFQLGIVGALLFTFCDSLAQKNDYIWLSGYDSKDVIDSAVYGFRYGNTKLDFNFQPVSVKYDSLSMNFDFTNTSICNNDGQLLFYTNGIYIANDSDQAIANSNGLNAGYIDEVWDPTIQQDGYRNAQGIIALQDIVNKNYYHLIYSFTDSFPGSLDTIFYISKILTALVDMSGNGGLGNVLYKNQILIQDSLGVEVQAVRHGNGRDWWVLSQKRGSNCFFRTLLSPDSLLTSPDLTCTGDTFINGYTSAASFTPDGNKYIYLAPYQGLNIYDFDRCSGVLSNPQFMPLPIYNDSNWGGFGVAVSPNSRFLYVTATKQVYQLDLQSGDVFGSIDTVALFDGFALPIGSYFNTPQLGPDGKIYISCGNAEADYHVINNPDAKGDSCNFVQHGVRLPTLCNSVPNFPNYRLGAWTGSVCDTISGLNELQRAAKEQIIKVYPNPATDYAIVDYGFADWNKAQPDLEICNAIGQVIYKQTLPMYSGFQKIDVTNFSAGIYLVYIKRDGAVIATQKLVKQ